METHSYNVTMIRTGTAETSYEPEVVSRPGLTVGEAVELTNQWWQDQVEAKQRCFDLDEVEFSFRTGCRRLSFENKWRTHSVEIALATSP